MTIRAPNPVKITGRVVAHHRGDMRPRRRNRSRRNRRRPMQHDLADATAPPPSATSSSWPTPAEADHPSRTSAAAARHLHSQAAGESAAPQVITANVDLALIATALPHDLNLRRLSATSPARGKRRDADRRAAKADLVDDVTAAIAEASRVPSAWKYSRSRRDDDRHRRARGTHRTRNDRRAPRLLRRREVDARQCLARRRATTDRRDPRGWKRPTHDDLSRAARASKWWFPDRHARPARSRPLDGRVAESNAHSTTSKVWRRIVASPTARTKPNRIAPCEPRWLTGASPQTVSRAGARCVVSWHS